MIILAYANYVIEAFMYDFKNGSKEIIQNGNLVSFFSKVANSKIQWNAFLPRTKMLY